MEILLANPRGFCAGVVRAIEIVERALEIYDAPIYVLHEIVHNRTVVENLKKRGAIFIESLSEAPENATVIFSAHGVSKQVQEEARHRKLTVFDAICPLVAKVHVEVQQHALAKREVIVIGRRDAEVIGTMGQYDCKDAGIYLVQSEQDVEGLDIKNPDHLAYVTQTTLTMDEALKIIQLLQARFPSIQGPKKDDICYATQNRQDAVKKLSKVCDTVLVVGSRNSSNSNRLKETAERCETNAFLIDNALELKPEWLIGAAKVGISAGASAPEILVQGVIQKLQDLGGKLQANNDVMQEDIKFSLPKNLERKAIATLLPSSKKRSRHHLGLKNHGPWQIQHRDHL